MIGEIHEVTGALKEKWKYWRVVVVEGQPQRQLSNNKLIWIAAASDEIIEPQPAREA